MARAIVQGFAEQGGYKIFTDGRQSTTTAQRSFPGCTVNVYLAGTVTPATIFSDVIGTPKANPFISDDDGYWFFWADDGQYDVQFSGGGITTPFTLFNFTIGQSGAINDPGSNGILVRTAPNTATPRTIVGVTSETAVTNGDGVAGNPIIGLATFLEFTGKTLNGGTYLSPSIASFASANHNHENAAGGGQLNATNVFSAGTVPVARLPIMVGASAITPGVAGLVPAPAAGEDDLFLRGDGSWQAAGGGGGGTPASPNLSLQYNNAGSFGGVTGTSSDGTQVTWTDGVLRATSPRITTNIKDANGNAILTLNAVGSSVNNLQLANAAAGGMPTVTAIGTDANINIQLVPKGTGVVLSTGSLTISNNTPTVTLIDVNDSKQARIVLSGGVWQFINDTAGTTPISIDTVTSAVTLASDLFFSKASAITISRPSQTDLSLSDTTGVFTFGQIPVLPATDPTTDNQAVRKAFVRTRWSATFFIADVAARGVDADFSNIQGAWIPGSNFTATHVGAKFGAGTASGSFTLTFRKQPFGSQAQTDLGTITFNSGTLGVGVETDIADHTFTANDFVYAVITAASSPLQRSVWLSIRGFQTPQNP